jgi:hypothetical protein
MNCCTGNIKIPSVVTVVRVAGKFILLLKYKKHFFFAFDLSCVEIKNREAKIMTGQFLTQKNRITINNVYQVHKESVFSLRVC